jgi:hypothetical protein
MVVVVIGAVMPVVVLGGTVAADAVAKIVIMFVHIRQRKHLFNGIIFKFEMR